MESRPWHVLIVFNLGFKQHCSFFEYVMWAFKIIILGFDCKGSLKHLALCESASHWGKRKPQPLDQILSFLIQISSFLVVQIGYGCVLCNYHLLVWLHFPVNCFGFWLIGRLFLSLFLSVLSSSFYWCFCLSLCSISFYNRFYGRSNFFTVQL